jgi:hypothetical protein
MRAAGINARIMSAHGVGSSRRCRSSEFVGPVWMDTKIRKSPQAEFDRMKHDAGLAERGMTAFETEALESCRSLAMDPAGLSRVVALVEIRPECAKSLHENDKRRLKQARAMVAVHQAAPPIRPFCHSL